MNSKTKLIRRKWIITGSVILLFVIILIIALDSRLFVRRYKIEAEEISSPVRIVLVTDLHSCEYGEAGVGLVEAIDKEKPDIILLGGDIFDDVKEDTNTELFLSGIAGRYPCYYVTGNHECWGGRYRFDIQMSILEKYGITILSGETVAVEINGEIFNICGVDDPDIYMVKNDIEADPQWYIRAQTDKVDSFIGQLEEFSAEGGYNILLSHRPEYFELYTEYNFDLVLCGHAHGGQWRIPGILNGLYAPHQGIFPKYAGGQYEAEDMTMIVSRGLARETTWVPRIFNRPELVVIELE